MEYYNYFTAQIQVFLSWILDYLEGRLRNVKLSSKIYPKIWDKELGGGSVDWEGNIGKIKILNPHHCEEECDGWDAFSRCQFIRIVQPAEVSANFEIPEIEGLFEPKLIVGWLEVDDYPDLDELDTLGIMLEQDERDILINKLYLYSDKLAGWADWVQYPQYPNCPTCNQPMNQFVFQLASEDNIPYAWGDYGEGYIMQCPEHKDLVAFLWQC